MYKALKKTVLGSSLSFYRENNKVLKPVADQQIPKNV
jgi:hypothetical protein